MSEQDYGAYLFSKRTAKVSDGVEKDEYVKFFKQHYQACDELWRYYDIRILSGTAGVILVRDNKAIARRIEMMS